MCKTLKSVSYFNYGFSSILMAYNPFSSLFLVKNASSLLSTKLHLIRANSWNMSAKWNKGLFLHLHGIRSPPHCILKSLPCFSPLCFFFFFFKQSSLQYLLYWQTDFNSRVRRHFCIISQEYSSYLL